MNAGKHARWYCGGCVNMPWHTPPKDLVACPLCCGFKKPESKEAAK